MAVARYYYYFVWLGIAGMGLSAGERKRHLRSRGK